MDGGLIFKLPYIPFYPLSSSHMITKWFFFKLKLGDRSPQCLNDQSCSYCTTSRALRLEVCLDGCRGQALRMSLHPQKSRKNSLHVSLARRDEMHCQSLSLAQHMGQPPKHDSDASIQTDPRLSSMSRVHLLTSLIYNLKLPRKSSFQPVATKANISNHSSDKTNLVLQMV